MGRGKLVYQIEIEGTEGPVDPGFGQPGRPGVWPQPPGQPVDPGWGQGRPLPPHVGGGPVYPGGPPVAVPPIHLPGAPPQAPGSPENPIMLPPVMWPPAGKPPGAPSVPGNPIVIPPDRIPGGGVMLPIYPPVGQGDNIDNSLPGPVPPAGAYVLVWVVGTDQFKLVFVGPPTAQPKRFP